MAEKRLAIPSKELQLQIVGPKGVTKASRVQRFGLNTDIPSTTHDQIGSSLHVGEAKDAPNVTLTFSAFDVGIKTFSVLTGTDETAYPAGGVDIRELGEIDAVIFVKDTVTSDYVKSAHARKLQIRDFTFNYSVDGESTEDYTAVGSERRWLKYDTIVDKFTVGTTSFTLTQTPIQLKNGNYVLSVIVDGDYLTETTGVPTDTQYSISGTTLTTGVSRTSQVIAVYHANPTGDNWTDVSDSDLPVAIKGNNVTVNISANDIPRVQSININGNLNPTAVNQMGSRTIIGYQRQVPTVEGTITVLDTDTELINLFEYGTTTTSGVVEWTPGEGCSVSGVSLKIQLTDPCDTTAPYTVVKTVLIPSVTITSEAYSANVNQNTTAAYNWKSTTGECIVYSGAA